MVIISNNYDATNMCFLNSFAVYFLSIISGNKYCDYSALFLLL